MEGNEQFNDNLPSISEHQTRTIHMRHAQYAQYIPDVFFANKIHQYIGQARILSLLGHFRKRIRINSLKNGQKEG